MNKECEKCGSCCKYLLLDATLEDAAREPLIVLKANHKGSGYCLNSRDRKDLGCAFLDGNLCGIYETRPDMCRDFKPGCTQCLESRRDKI